MGSPAARRERLSAADASNIVIDAPDQVNAFLMAGVLAPGGPIGPGGEVDLRALRAALGALIPSAPRLSQRVVRDGRRLAWERVPVDLEAHVRLADPVDGLPGLESLCARLMVTAMPTDRPLWELLLVPGAGRDRLGVVLRIHHAMADGLAAVGLVELLLGPTGSSPAAADVAARGEGVEPTATAESVVPARRGLRARFRMLASGWERTAAVLRPAVPRTILLGPIGPRRGVAFVDVPLEALAAGASTIGATVNDALLAAAAAAAEDALRSRGRPIPPVLPASVPVALGARGRSGNAVGVMLVPLPTGESDVTMRLARIAALTRARKADARSRGQFELTRTRTGTALFRRLVRFQRLIVMFVTNVPGPRHRLALAGAPLEQVWPVSAIQGNVRLSVAALSYDGMLRCAVHCDADAIPATSFAVVLGRELERVAALA
ncbi:wax ester/triacylglycerol synthase domain-containing protein [Agromyces sp. M3QZ16-3]|uniref:wax ester/triacylglycerol synthase domain-containing protein n=1 Tax=Agromyces sp. M3QZ16-3 TaxID=3447585 RepID=UPI003F6905D2